ncbi:hypothetical protein [Rosenbergiella metrosideri]|nr:hypothetical protein [Rosenbergiella metrosideri]
MGVFIIPDCREVLVDATATVVKSLQQVDQWINHPLKLESKELDAVVNL